MQRKSQGFLKISATLRGWKFQRFFRWKMLFAVFRSSSGVSEHWAIFSQFWGDENLERFSERRGKNGENSTISGESPPKTQIPVACRAMVKRVLTLKNSEMPKNGCGHSGGITLRLHDFQGQEIQDHLHLVNSNFLVASMSLWGVAKGSCVFHGSRSSRETKVQNASCQMGGREVTR